VLARILLSAQLFCVLTLLLTACGGSNSGGGSPPPPPATGEWTWISGSDLINDPSNYGLQGQASPNNDPGGRSFSNNWKDLKGNLWLMGGATGFGYTPVQNDLWNYNPASNEWTWMGDSSSPNPPGDYGQLRVAAASNVPGGRSHSVSWTDSSGNFWLFGGFGFDASGSQGGGLNDLWQYQASTGLWTWMNGSNTVNSSASYGTLGVAASTNVPGPREIPSAWIDSSGNLWLFGGDSSFGTDNFSYFNDLWQFNPTTKEWTWVSGSNTPNADGVYGSLGTPAAENVPGARTGAANWMDSSGHLWLFGGVRLTASSAYFFNDLWKFDPSATAWTWMAGSNTPSFGYSGIYGTLGVPSSNNLPGSRAGTTTWTDHNGNFWLYGGHGYDSALNEGSLNDLWKFNPSTGQWAWMSGSNMANGPSSYGTKGEASASNVPSARGDASAWVDSSDNLWLFGGDGFDANGNGGELDDLWRWQPAQP
jgi:N-acetylneuraminic acid mutarotase